jgi:molybdopterin converting factor small subunit
VIEVRLFGKLRRFAENPDVKSESVIRLSLREADTIQSIIEHIGIPLNEVGNNIFLNGEYSALERTVKDGDRLGIFPDDMQLLYKWWFKKEGKLQ